MARRKSKEVKIKFNETRYKPHEYYYIRKAIFDKEALDAIVCTCGKAVRNKIELDQHIKENNG